METTERSPGSSASRGRPPTFSGFAIRLVLYLFAISLLFSLGQLHLYMQPVQRLIARLAAAGANVIGAEAEVHGFIIQAAHAGLEINHECTGVFVLLVYGAFVLAYPAGWLQRLSGLAVGAVVLMLVNVSRLIALTAIASRSPSLFGYFHEYFFQGVFIALLALLASLWTEQVRRASTSGLSA